ncbi:MAG: endonuclease/exonuclease/phosphatase family protein [Candidatus Dependentiae bacterium]|jgi:endonuclease/exonuclease/phosphatase family metal-dependent hydrolase|nr:endonuclease/exonuclease/phosphatase family protein [Candidatus Dependentiae bacterium]
MQYHRVFLSFLILLSLANPVAAMESTKKGLSSIWNALAAGTLLSREQKWDAFVQDCEKYNKNFFVPQKSPDVLRIGTYNLHCLVDPYSNKDPNSTANIANVIKGLDADVLLLQEMGGLNGSFNRSHDKDFHMDKALEKMGYAFEPIKTWKMYNGFGNVFCTKKNFPMTSVVKKIFDANFAKPDNDDEKRGFVGGHFVWNGKKVAAYTLHLDVWDQSEKTRVEQVKELIAFIKKEHEQNPDITYIVGGDFNAVRKQDYDYQASGKKVWDLLVEDDLARKIETKEDVAKLFEKEKDWLVNVYDVLADQAPGFTSCFGKVIDYSYYTPGAGLTPKKIYADYTTVKSEKVDPKTGKGTGKIYTTTPSDHLAIVVDFKDTKPPLYCPVALCL